jgi:hypothetical protein
MDALHSVMRSLRGETKARRDQHLTVFREFLDHLDRAARRGAPSARSAKTAKPKRRRGRK